MKLCKVWYAVALLATAGGLLRDARAANEIVVRQEVWSFDAVDGWSRLAPSVIRQLGSAGADLHITVPTLDTTPGRVNVLRISDSSTTAPGHDVGGVVLHTVIPGQVANAGTPLVVLVAPESTPYGESAALVLPAGVVNFGGLSVVGPPDVFGNSTADDASRDAVKLFATITGDLTGNISVGEVQRFVATGVTQPDGSLIGGSIVPDVVLEATKEVPIVYGTQGTSDSPSINFVRLGGGLHGTIRATDAGIFRVVVGSSDSPGVITGTIEAPRGSIGIVECSGDIGQGATARITAGDSIRQIRVNRQDASGTVVPTDIDADISAGTLYPSDLDGRASVPDSIAGDLERLSKIGTIGLIESTKDISGSIRALNLGRGIGSTTAAGFSRDGRLGIVARGKLSAEINIDWNVDDADIIGEDVGRVFIGNQLNGSVVSFGKLTDHDRHDRTGGGTITTLGIGYGATPPSTVLVPALLGMPAELAATYPPGFVGSVHAPMNRDLFRYVPPTAAGPQPPAERFPEEYWFPQRVVGDTGSRDGVVYANLIQEGCYIAAMSQRYRVDLRHPYRPRVEVKTFGKDLRIGTMSSGVVWSGRLPFAWVDGLTYVPAFQPTAPHHQLMETRGREYLYYASELNGNLPRYPSNVDNVDIGCMGPAADVYCFGLWGRFNVLGDMLGEIHVPEMLAGVPLRVHGRLGAESAGDTGCGDPGDAPTGPWPDNRRWATFSGAEPSPRGHDQRKFFVRDNAGQLAFGRGAEPDLAEYGSVRLGELRGLNGSIIVHADAVQPPEGTPWSQDPSYLNGLVWLGDRPVLDTDTVSFTPRIMGRSVYTDSSLVLPRYAELGRNLSQGLQTSLTRAGGSVALAPYALHGNDCSPPSTDVGDGLPYSLSMFFAGIPDPANTGQNLSAVYMTYYGPLVWGPNPEGILLRICFQPLGAADWIDVTDRFTVLFQEGGRRIEFFAGGTSSDLPTDGSYRVSLPDQVRCARVEAEALLVEGSAPIPVGQCGTPIYRFRLISCMLGGLPNPADVNHDGNVDGDDFIAFINSFALGDASIDPAADVAGTVVLYPVPGSNPATSIEESFPDGTIDGGDFIAFINAFSIGCD
jgi:hypothetical protein